jgi:hypothetical protein
LLLERFGLRLIMLRRDEAITGSFWGDSEAGIKGHAVYARKDTPVHSLLHEMCHTICMSTKRRNNLDRDAGGDDLEEAAVCYLQIVLADELEGVGRARMMRDMDAWGYSFRLGDTSSWFHGDAEDARHWLQARGILNHDGAATFGLRQQSAEQ